MVCTLCEQKAGCIILYYLGLFQNSGSFERATLDVHAVFLLFCIMYGIILLM